MWEYQIAKEMRLAAMDTNTTAVQDKPKLTFAYALRKGDMVLTGGTPYVVAETPSDDFANNDMLLHVRMYNFAKGHWHTRTLTLRVNILQRFKLADEATRKAFNLDNHPLYPNPLY